VLTNGLLGLPGFLLLYGLSLYYSFMWLRYSLAYVQKPDNFIGRGYPVWYKCNPGLWYFGKVSIKGRKNTELFLFKKALKML
jgi:hypothetical protein